MSVCLKHIISLIKITILALALCSTSLIAHAQSKDVIGQIAATGEISVGNGPNPANVADSVHPYISADTINVPSGSSAALRLNDEQGFVSLAADTIATVSRGNVVRADGDGVRFMFKQGSHFRVEMDCFVIEPVSAVPQKVSQGKKWVGGAIVKSGTGSRLQVVHGNLRVSTRGDTAFRKVWAGEQFRACNTHAAMIKTASARPSGSSNAVEWVLGAGVIGLALLGGSNGAVDDSRPAGSDSRPADSDTGSSTQRLTNASPTNSSDTTVATRPQTPAATKPVSPVLSAPEVVTSSAATQTPVASVDASDEEANGKPTNPPFSGPKDPVDPPASPVKGSGKSSGGSGGSSGGGK